MTPELIGIVAAGVALAGLVLVALRENARVLRAEIKNLREDMNKRFEFVHAEIKDGRADTNQQFESVRAEIKDGRAEVKDLREDTNRQFKSVRAEIGSEIKSVRADIESLRADMAELRERMARIEGMFEGLLRREPEPKPAVAGG